MTHPWTEIVETDGDEILSANEELTKDLISIITSFSARLYALMNGVSHVSEVLHDVRGWNIIPPYCSF